MPSTGPNPRHRFLFALFAAFALGIAVYLPGLPGSYVFDDYSNIVRNPAIANTPEDVRGLLRAAFSAPVSGLSRPLSTLSFIASKELIGFTPEAFKLVNIGIHLACGLLLWFLAREILRAYARRQDSLALDPGQVAWLALAAVTLWLVHPLNLTAVLYIVQRETALAALFSIGAMWTYLAGRRRMLEGRDGRWLIWMWTPLLMVLGVLCKESAVLTPVYLLVTEFTLLGFRGRDGGRDRVALTFFGLFLILPFLAGGVLAALRPGFFFEGYVARDFTLYERLLTEARVLMDYLRWAALPDLRQLALFHDDFTVSRGLLQPLTTLLSLAGVAALLALAVACRRRLPLLSFGILWFFAGQLLESTVLPLELVFEHRNYLPLFGLILGCAGTVYVMAARAGGLRAALLVFALLLPSFAFATAMRAADWRSELAFAHAESAHHPGSARAATELQWAYMIYVMESSDRRAIPLAQQAAEQAKRLVPHSVTPDVGLAYMYASLQDWQAADTALASAAGRAGAADPDASLQLALQSLMQLDEPEDKPLFESIRRVYAGALGNPRVSPYPCYAAGIWNDYALFLEGAAGPADALGAMHQAVTLCPSYPAFHLNFANMLLHYGDARDAKLQIDALAAIDDFRYREDLRQLEEKYRRLNGD